MEKREFHFSSPDSHIFYFSRIFVYSFWFCFVFYVFPFFLLENLRFFNQINFFSNLAIAEESLFSRFYDIR